MIFCDPDAPTTLWPSIGETYEPIRQLCASARARRLPVFYTQGLVAADGSSAGLWRYKQRYHAEGRVQIDGSKGAAIIPDRGGRPPRGFVAPTILLGATPEMRVWREEIFGPVAPLTRFSSDDEAVALANDAASGLAAYIFTADHRRGWRIAERLQTGMVGLNEAAISTEVAPFGGVKESGFGRESPEHMIEDYTVVKTLMLRGMSIWGEN